MSKPTYEELEQRIRELEQTEIRLKKSEKAMQQYKRAVGVSIDLMVEFDSNYTYLFANKGYLKYHQLNEEQIIGHSFGEVIGEDYFDNKIKPYFDRCLNGETINFETAYNYRGKGKCHMEVWYYPRIEEDGQIRGVVALSRDITERKRAEEKLRESENKFRSITENAVDFIFIKDQDRRYTFVNQAMTTLLGLPEKEILGKSPDEIFDSKQASIIKTVDDRSFSGKTVNETRSLVINDIPFFFNTIQTPLSKKDGKVSSIMGIVRDVTDQKLAEEALRENEEQFRLLIHRIQAAVVVHGADTQIIASNPKAHELLGLTEDQMLGKTAIDNDWKFLDADGKEMPLEEYPVNRVLATQKTLRDFTVGICRSEKNDLVWVLVNANPVFDNKGNIQQVIVTFVDITERKQTEEKLRESELKFKLIAENIENVFWMSTCGIEKMVYVSPGYDILWESSREDLYQHPKSFIETIHPDDLDGYRRVIDKYHKNGKLYEVEYRILSRNGEVRWINEKGYPVPDLFDGSQLMTGVCTDITDRKRAEEDKIKALEFAAEQSRHALVGQVAGKMAHDFNNVLMGIMGNAQLATMDCDNEELKVMLENINEFALRGRDITNNLISYSKDQEPKQTYFKIEDKIELVLKMLEKDLSGIKISRNYKPGIAEILADPGMIQDSLVNIIQNSIHAMSKVENPTLTLKAYSKGNKVYIEAEDNGCGIPKEHLDSIYTPSFTLKGSHDETGSYKSDIKGTGYGMSNVKKYIVEKHRGDIFLESEVGQGTKITIALRIIKDHLSSAEKEEIVKSQIYDQRKILLVEDESAIADVQYQILTKEPFGHIVSIATNGQIAIDTFDRNKFDIVSLDYMLPGNLNGLDVYHHIRESDKDIPIIFISGNIEFLQSMKKLKQKDPNLEYLPKPIDNLDYVNKINELAGSAA
jgi:PAS domain S-box-containing protein